ncbi:hypothetical protein Airi01_076110 [Actinoallomurus iriomotensis]|uniref:Uncharacterized protein n=1 Tax=Actinoallomurus iriomotensis TaxID=478107 RepID=A0A9W6VTP5_9ACTN|nr:hypothetical protein Airi01_076110 [Actinoallomurus iriomotensis]
MGQPCLDAGDDHLAVGQEGVLGADVVAEFGGLGDAVLGAPLLVERVRGGEFRRVGFVSSLAIVSNDLETEFVAEMMVRISGSLLAISSHIIDLDDDEQLAALARRFLVPMLEPGVSRPAP